MALVEVNLGTRARVAAMLNRAGLAAESDLVQSDPSFVSVDYGGSSGMLIGVIISAVVVVALVLILIRKKSMKENRPAQSHLPPNSNNERPHQELHTQTPDMTGTPVATAVAMPVCTPVATHVAMPSNSASAGNSAMRFAEAAMGGQTLPVVVAGSTMAPVVAVGFVSTETVPVASVVEGAWVLSGENSADPPAYTYPAQTNFGDVDAPPAYTYSDAPPAYSKDSLSVHTLNAKV